MREVVSICIHTIINQRMLRTSTSEIKCVVDISNIMKSHIEHTQGLLQALS